MKSLRFFTLLLVLIGACVISFVWRKLPFNHPNFSGSGMNPTKTFTRETAAHDSRTFAEIASRMKHGNPEDIDRWLASLAQPYRDEALSVLAAEWAVQHPERAEAYARRIEEPALRGEAVALVLVHFFERDPDGALKKLREETDPLLRDAIEKRIIPALADLDAAAAARLLAEGPMDSAAFTTMVTCTVQRWAQQDARDAAQWITTINDDALRKDAATALTPIWAQRNASEMESWFAEHPDLSSDLQAAYQEWKHPTTAAQREAWANQAHHVPDGSLSEPCGHAEE